MQLTHLLRRTPRSWILHLQKIEEPKRFISAAFAYNSLLSTTPTMILNKHQTISRMTWRILLWL
jgi:hypothetical protein